MAEDSDKHLQAYVLVDLEMQEVQRWVNLVDKEVRKKDSELLSLVQAEE